MRDQRFMIHTWMDCFRSEKGMGDWKEEERDGWHATIMIMMILIVIIIIRRTIRLDDDSSMGVLAECASVRTK